MQVGLSGNHAQANACALIMFAHGLPGIYPAYPVAGAIDCGGIRCLELPDARASLLAWLERRDGTVEDYVFPSRVDCNGHLSTRQYARPVDEWVSGIGLMRSEYGPHSLRRTIASITYGATGNLRAVQILLRHSKMGNTVRYLGIVVGDARALAENTAI